MASYTWESGESPVPDLRIGVVRLGLNIVDHAISPTGIYFVPEVVMDHGGYQTVLEASFVQYADHGSSNFYKLCGRVDCTHDNEDCNAYIYQGSDLSFYQGNLYAVSGEGAFTDRCMLMRIAADGSDHEVILDLLKFAKDQGCDFAQCDQMSNGYCVFSLYQWRESESDQLLSEWVGSYKFRLDGTMSEPVSLGTAKSVLYQCGDIPIGLSYEVKDAEEVECAYAVDLNTGDARYLTEWEIPLVWLTEQNAYYFENGVLSCKDYESGEKKIVLDTGLRGDYFPYFFPDCIVLASNQEGNTADQNLYVYNWAWEFVDKVELDYQLFCSARFALLSETAERLILTDAFLGAPLYYIEKSELGTGNCVVHEYHYS